jgi:hypothetical protein
VIRDPRDEPWHRSERKKPKPERRRSRGCCSHTLDDFFCEFVAQEAAAVERLPDRFPNRCHVVGTERRVHHP